MIFQPHRLVDLYLQILFFSMVIHVDRDLSLREMLNHVLMPWRLGKSSAYFSGYILGFLVTCVNLSSSQRAECNAIHQS
jgi:hypothetical protein